MKTIYDVGYELTKNEIQVSIINRKCFLMSKNIYVEETDEPNIFNVTDGHIYILKNAPFDKVIDFFKNNMTSKKDEPVSASNVPTDTQKRITEVLDGMKDLLLYKNQKYGDSAIKPKKIFYKGDSTNSILIRLDDKICRVISNTEERPRVNDVADIIGYCTLLLISMGVTPEDIAKFKD